MKLQHIFFAAPLLLVSLTIGYYFGIFLPRQAAMKDLEKNQTDCSQLDDKVSAEYAKDSMSSTQISHHYNSLLHRCIFDEYTTSNSSGFDNGIYNKVEIENISFADEQNILFECDTITGYYSYQIKDRSENCTDYRTVYRGQEMSTSSFPILQQQYMTQ